MTTVADNERRIERLEAALDGCVQDSLCDERNGRVMDAVEGLRDTTQNLSTAMDQLRKENTASLRASKATLISVLVAGALLVGGALLKHFAEG